MTKDKPKNKTKPIEIDEWKWWLAPWQDYPEDDDVTPPEDSGKRSGILEHELSQEYWLDQYDNYIGQGGTLTYPQFMQQQINNKISKQIEKRAVKKFTTKFATKIQRSLKRNEIVFS